MKRPILTLLSCLCFILFTKAQTRPTLGLAESFGIFSADTIFSTDSLIVDGSIGYSINSSSLNKINGSTCQSTCSTFSQVITDITSARSQCSSQSGTTLVSGQTDGLTLNSGVFEIDGDWNLGGTLTLEGDTSSIFIFNIDGSLYLQSSFSLNTSGVLAGNIIFNIGNSLNTSSDVIFSGIILTGYASNISNGFGGNHCLLSLNNISLSGSNYFKSSNILLNVFFNPLYFGRTCGLKYVQASKPLNQRVEPGTNTGSTQPVTLSVTIPSGATILQAYVFFAAVSTLTPLSSYSIAFTPAGSGTTNVTANQSGIDAFHSICWGNVSLL